MKKAVCIALVLFLVGFNVFGGGDKQKAGTGQKTVKIGYTVVELGHPFWSSFSTTLEGLCKEKGWQFTALDGRADSGTQITQIENFITSGTDIIVVQPVDPTYLTDIVKVAHEKGIIMMGHGISYASADTNFVDDNFACGKAVGIAAGNWVYQRYGTQEIEAGLYEYPYVQEGVDRVDGVKAGLAETKANVKIVATGATLSLPEGMTYAETWLQAHPNIKVFLGISDGAALGACEVLESKGVNPDDYAVFGVDATREALAKITGNTPFKMTVSKGTPEDVAVSIMKVLEAIRAGNYEKRYVAPTITVDKSNVGDFITK
jgi:ribose transport system substrate-binding protein